MKYLADANVLSEPTKPSPSALVERWLDEHESHLVVDPIILGEVHFGILNTPMGRKRSALESWFKLVVMNITCVPWDAATSVRWSELLHKLRKSGFTMPILDSMIAATALTHGFVIATRNTRDFAAVGLRVVNPFEK